MREGAGKPGGAELATTVGLAERTQALIPGGSEVEPGA